MEKGKLYGVGVGCGDKELITLKAVKVLEQCDYAAVPLMKNGNTTAYDIAKEHIGNIITFNIEMSKDYKKQEENYAYISHSIITYLDKGKNVAFVTLGDPTIYSTYMRIDRIVRGKGYETEIIPGITAFSASAAKLHMSLCERDKPLLILPYGNYEKFLHLEGNKVIMKTGRNFPELYNTLKENNLLENASLVENCGMEKEKTYPVIDENTHSDSYFNIVFIKE